jgi:exosortase/archaeosortase family protein
MGLFIGFVVAYPGAWIPRLAFIFIGIGVIYIKNIVRVIVITLIQVQAPDMLIATSGDPTIAIFCLVIFALWIVWANYGDNTHAINSSSHII